MKILVAANQKGGVGKTAALVHLAFNFVERGLKVAVIDLDTQGNASYTLADYRGDALASAMFAENSPEWLQNTPPETGLLLIASDPGLANLERLSLENARARFQTNIEVLRETQFDVCLIDTAPSMGIGLMSALYVSDYVFSPIELEAYSVQGLTKLLTTISHVRKHTPGMPPNPKLHFLGMLPSKVDSRKPRQVRNLAELKAAYPDLLIPFSIGFRDGIAEALASGVPVWHIKTTAAREAAKETRAVADYIFKKMELSE
ncbi:ParA family protein [Nitrosovibrio sp. Nv4]|uniref:ParA family protein n=1 Tax=Nitrosovibrio sp. Nv4 TaxID=1945880 RepID=UPI000BC891D6|nr:ParA family protein [Nitrosovibrio sp. Nv4]SOD42757.1 chromosome partitioning protein [Nitrosovibrio sp. Nv4]